jgi:hypothetical protein
LLFLIGSPFTEGFGDRIAIASMIGAACYLLVLPICIGFLSLSYRHFALFDQGATGRAVISLASRRRTAVIVAILIAIWIFLIILR